MKTIYVLYQLLTKENDTVTKEYLGTYDSIQDARDAFKDFLLNDGDGEILIEKEEIDDSDENLTKEQTIEQKMFILEVQMSKLSELINRQAGMMQLFNERLRELEK